MICFAVIDTNVLVSALLSVHSDAATVQVVSRLIGGEIIPVYSNEIMHEYREVLARKKFKFEPDLPFYEVVLEKREDGAYLITGNLKHFPERHFIVTARQMLEILDGKGGKII